VKRSILTLLICMIGIWGSGFQGLLEAQEKPLRIYGPDGPSFPLRECADLLSQIYAIKAEVITGPGATWIPRAREDADIVYEEAEHLLSQFMTRYPCLVDQSTRASLYLQPTGILVRKGNPKKIHSFEHLAGTNIYLLDVFGGAHAGLWEDVAGLKDIIPGVRKRIVMSVETGAEAVEKWKTVPELDAWVTFESWHVRLRDASDWVRLPKGERIYRGTAAVITHFYKNRETARMFMEFLQTRDCRAVFQKWGWE